jgi:segregation and condensation protein A
LIAATLVELKARRLLPGVDEVELDEELLRFEERDLLLARLLECKTFKDASKVLERRLRRAARSMPRTAGPEEPFRSLAPDPLASITLEAFAAAATRALTPPEDPVVQTDHVAPVRASVRDAVESILAILPDTRAVTFRDLVVGITERVEVVVRFLAVLELYKQGVVDLEQPSTFAELSVRRLGEGETALDQISLDDWDDTAHSVAPAPVTVGLTDQNHVEVNR